MLLLYVSAPLLFYRATVDCLLYLLLLLIRYHIYVGQNGHYYVKILNELNNFNQVIFLKKNHFFKEP